MEGIYIPEIFSEPDAMVFLFCLCLVLGSLFLLMWWQGRKGP